MAPTADIRRELEAVYERFLKAVSARDAKSLEQLFEPLSDPIKDPKWWDVLMSHMTPEVLPVLARGRFALLRRVGDWAGYYLVRDAWFHGQLEVLVIKFWNKRGKWRVTGFFDRTQVPLPPELNESTAVEGASATEPALKLPGEAGSLQDASGKTVRTTLRP